jgi:hypothetical protein
MFRFKKEFEIDIYKNLQNILLSQTFWQNFLNHIENWLNGKKFNNKIIVRTYFVFDFIRQKQKSNFSIK